MDTVENVTLGSSNFNTARTSYNNAISTLNNRASAYNNSTYSDRVRSVGSDPDNPSDEETEMYTSSESFMSRYTGTFKDEDRNYSDDVNQMEDLGILASNKNYWLASRNVVEYSGLPMCYFYMRYVDIAKGDDDEIICSIGDGYTNADTYTYGLRPVFRLKDTVQVTGGTGEEGNPYTLGT